MSVAGDRDHARRPAARALAWLSAWWLPAACVLVFGATVGVSLSREAKPVTPERYARVAASVRPPDGYRLPVKWGNLGPTLVRLGVIDVEKIRALHETAALPDLRRLDAPSEAPIVITAENEWFLVTVLWGLGLANQSPILDALRLERGETKIRGLASTGGWTLGAKPGAELYSRFEIVRLTPPQWALVAELAQTIHRPCCGNSTAFPDCNHGMALLGLIELMVANGSPREEIVKAALRVNAFWFPREYTKTALLFDLRGVEWDAIDPRELLGPRYSSLTGWEQNVDTELRKYTRLLGPGTEGARCVLS